MIAIDKKIPIPEIRQGIKKYPFDTMNIGDSFLFEHKYDSNRIAVQRIGAIAASWVKRNNSKKKFSCRKIEGNIRVWRIK